ncbi:MAG: tRNA (adenosine(37)-N6)-threonylcarbamoyltransferase complex ATPase subunit type 1 TsaE [bacterium]
MLKVSVYIFNVQMQRAKFNTKKYFTKNFLKTENFGEEIAKKILKNFLPQTVVIGLVGDLGSGKTTFLKGFAKGLGVKEKILSPTFVILKRFKIVKCKHKNFYHLDCYRIEKEKEILELGFKEIISDPQNIVCIEWADKIKNMLPPDTLFLHFEFINENTRKIVVNREL